VIVLDSYSGHPALYTVVCRIEFGGTRFRVSSYV